jgi:hypothetical protein
MSRFAMLASWCAAVAVIAVMYQARSLSQPQEAPKPPPPRTHADMLRMSLAAEKPGLADPFRGITSGGKIEVGLFPVRSTGVSTEPVRRAATEFLASLSSEQRAKTQFAVDDDEWRKWMNQSFYIRQGVSFDEMNEKQRAAAFNLLRAGLSAKGLQLTRDIMRLNGTLAEMTNHYDELGEGKYHITVMGEPSATLPWGWQLDGHHAIINYFVLGDQVVMTPAFAGSEPVVAHTGKFKGTIVLQDEQNKGLALFHALSAEQRGKALIKGSKTGNLALTEAWKDNVIIDYAGINAKELSDSQRQQLLDLAAIYVNNMAEGHARVKMDDVRKHLDRTWFSWIGGFEKDSVFYYRIHSPVIMIEFDHQTPATLRYLYADPKQPRTDHIHTIVRTPNGNDYGKDLLRQHYLKYPHEPARKG